MHRGADTPIRSAISLVLWTALTILCLTLVTPARAGTIWVNSRDDTNQNDAVVTLREALLIANGSRTPFNATNPDINDETDQVTGTVGAGVIDIINVNNPPIPKERNGIGINISQGLSGLNPHHFNA